MADHRSGEIAEWHAAIALRTPVRQPDILRKARLQSVQMVCQLALEHRLAGGSLQRHLEVRQQGTAAPHRERAKAATIGADLGYESIRHGQGVSQMSH